MSKYSFFSTKVSPRFKKVVAIFFSVFFGFFALFILLIWLISPKNSHFQDEYVQRIVENNTATDVKGIEKGDMEIGVLGDTEIGSDYKQNLSDYTLNISTNLQIIGTMLSLISDNESNSRQYTESLRDNMEICDFATYPYSLESIPFEELRMKVVNLEPMILSLCKTLVDESTAILKYSDSNDVRVLDEMKRLNDEAYEKNVLIQTECEKIDLLILL